MASLAAPRSMSDHLTSPNMPGLDEFAVEPERVDKPWGHELICAVN